MLALSVAFTVLPLFTGAKADPVTTAFLPKRSSHLEIAKAKRAASSALPLTDYHYPFSALPYQVNPFQPSTPNGRGPQTGYNRCNSTTEGPNSQCQTLVVNSLADFCVWGSPTANGTIGDIEAETVAYCSNAGHGTRIMPMGTITGAQFMKTKAYIQITGTFDQRGISLDPNDGGGELDPHGADLLGNPLGGLVYSNNLPTGNGKDYVQADSWNNFVGSNQFCFKVCDNSIKSPNYCENRYDLLGCDYNMPASYKEGEFTSCEGEVQDVVGTYTGSDGKTTVWKQPESLSPSTTLPWNPRIPASSNCKTFSAAQLYSASGSTLQPLPTSASATASGSLSQTTLTNSPGVSGGSTSRSTSAPSSTASGSASMNVANTGLFAILGAILFMI